MNFELALLWTALIAVIGFFVYIFYAVIKEHKSNKDKPRNKKTEGSKPVAISSGKSALSRADQSGTSIVSQISEIRNSNVEVINITNCPLNSKLVLKEKNLAGGSSLSVFTSCPGSPATQF